MKAASHTLNILAGPLYPAVAVSSQPLTLQPGMQGECVAAATAPRRQGWFWP